MGWLVGLPLGLFRLLGSILLVALRFAVPILILVAVILVVRHVRRRPPVAVVLLPWAGDAGARLLPAPADGGDL